ncbi:MAG: OmpA family protein [Planctomycetes bacterium]|nr:OmpA family protein [Planctomycetota bacterium]
MKWNQLTFVLALAACAPTLSSCTGMQYKAALDERDAENQQLRSDLADTKGENRDLSAQRDSLETALAEANARLLGEPQKQPGQNFSELDAEGIGYGMRDGRMVISIPQELTFAAGKAELSANGKKALKAVAKTLVGNYPKGEFWIEGHTDNDPISKSKFATNRDLSLARAMAVLDCLVNDCKIPDSRCVVAGWGPHRPVMANDSKTNKAKNRRVEIIVETVK